MEVEGGEDPAVTSMDPNDMELREIDVQEPQEARMWAVRSQDAEAAEHTIALAREEEGSSEV